MTMMRTMLALLLAGSTQAMQWASINCPSGSGNCNYRNTGSADEAVSLFFQVELASGETEGSFSCSDGQMTYCSRKWSAADSGSAGGCYFLLPAGGQFQCQTQGTIHFIGAHSAPLSGSVLSTEQKQVPCSGGSCTFTNTESADMWVAQSFETSGSSRNTYDCTYNNAGSTMTLCSYAVNGTGGYSCGYILPAKASMTCRAQGSISMRTSAALSFKQPYLAPSAAVETKWDCPLVSYPKPNMCDCAYTNNHNDQDLIVMVTSSSTDNGYNSFHCGIGGANVCAWGSNQNDYGNKGGCYFILPPNTEFSCQMEWGAASFSISTAISTKRSIFGTSKQVPDWRKRPATSEEPIDRTYSLNKHQEMFQKWKAHHNKQYANSVEAAQRFENFRKHLSAFLKKNKATDMPNSLADWSKAEYELHYRDCARTTPEGAVPPLPKELTITDEDIRSLPESIDWRTKGVVTPVKNQAQCGSCWSFSTTGVIEGAWAMAGNSLQSLSEQELVSCEKNCDGCDGGWPYLAIEYVKQNGDATEESYPYVSGQGNVPPCTAGHTMADVKVTGYYAVNNSEDAMAAALVKYGPVSITVDAMTQLWWPYTGGIMTGCCNHAPDHAVLLVGYGVDQGTKYWLIKNSWGADWGEDGYIRLERGSNQCGITSAPTLAFVQGGPPMPQPTCPPETVVTNNTDGTRTCEWRNNTKGVIIPPPQSLNADCSYWPKENSFSYIWDGSVSPPANYPCPPSSEHQEQGAAENFCVFYNGAKGLHIPTTATVDCSNLISQGRFSYTFRP